MPYINFYIFSKHHFPIRYTFNKGKREPRNRPRRTHRVSGQHHAPAAFTPGKEPVPIVKEAGWAPELLWIGAENLAPPGFDPQTFQPVASHYTDYTIPAPTHLIKHNKNYDIKCHIYMISFPSTDIFYRISTHQPHFHLIFLQCKFCLPLKQTNLD
jgi:hypothetical protein